MTNMCYRVSEPTPGMKLKRDGNTFKCYMNDTGLLLSQAFDEKEFQGLELYQKILLDKLEFNEGMVVENIVAQMLCASGHKLYFYSRSDRKEAENRKEIDFLVEKTVLSNRHNIYPIEVKSGKNYTLNSLKKFVTKFSEQVTTPIVLHSDDLKIADGIMYLPLYMAPCL